MWFLAYLYIFEINNSTNSKFFNVNINRTNAN